MPICTYPGFSFSKLLKWLCNPDLEGISLAASHHCNGGKTPREEKGVECVWAGCLLASSCSWIMRAGSCITTGLVCRKAVIYAETCSFAKCIIKCTFLHSSIPRDPCYAGNLDQLKCTSLERRRVSGLLLNDRWTATSVIASLSKICFLQEEDAGVVVGGLPLQIFHLRQDCCGNSSDWRGLLGQPVFMVPSKPCCAILNPTSSLRKTCSHVSDS